MKIGIFAGTFDPIHEGHIEFAKRAVSETELDKVIIVAEKDPYRKKPFASWDHRQAMIERATEDVQEADHDYEFSSILAHRHTMRDMLTAASKQYGKESEIWFLVGSDIFEHISRWEDMVDRDHYGGFIVALREDHTELWLDEKLEQLEGKNRSIDIKLIENHHPRISSRRIRDQIKADTEPSNLPSKVVQYIQKHNLYQPS